MPGKNSPLLPEAQSAFLEALPEIKENQVITGFDSFAQAQFCTPSFLGCRLCIGANVVGGFVTLSVQANTPVGGFSKSFRITNNISFSWNPIGVFKVEFKITNFRKTGGSFSFSASINLCLRVPFLGFKCKSFSHTFAIPTALADSHRQLMSAKADDDSFDTQEYSTLLLLHAMVEKENHCTCNED